MKSLIQQVIKGKAKAQNEFYDTYSPLVMGVCVRYLGKTDIANDAFQEAFVKIFKSLKHLKDEKAIHGWIKRITVNTALDHIKPNNQNIGLDLTHHELSDDFYCDLIDRMSEESILEVIGKLPEGYQAIFNLHVIDGFSHKEIAEKLNIAESTSRSQLTHAKRILRKYLNEIGITNYEKVI
ncbi:MAG: RNA polymerase sigma factor [Cyclobacteriaceae bacterium]